MIKIERGLMSEQEKFNQLPEEKPDLTPEQLQVLATARDQVIQWLNRKEFAGLNYTSQQMGQIRHALEDVRLVLEAGQAERVDITDSHKGRSFCMCCADCHNQMGQLYLLVGLTLARKISRFQLKGNEK